MTTTKRWMAGIDAGAMTYAGAGVLGSAIAGVIALTAWGNVPPGSPAAPPSPPTVPPSPPTAPPSPPTAHLQRNPATLAAPSAVPPNNPALLRLSRERQALELVDHAAHHALKDATQRIALMHSYIEAKGGTAQFAQFTRGFQSRGAQISFQTALDRSLDHLASRPIAPPTTDLAQLEQAVQVESAAAHASFNQLNAARRSVEMLGTFLAANHALADYQEWAGRQAAGPHAAGTTGAAAHDRRALQLGWDSAQLAQDAQAAPDVQNSPYPLTPPPGQAVAHGPYASTWWNSYADPYYDLAGYPAKDPGALQPVPPGNFGSTGAPVDYDWATSGYNRSNFPIYSDLGPNVVPAFGMFPSGAAGGASFGGGHGGR